MKRARLVVLSSLFAAACHGSDVDPKSGTWDFVEGEELENSCGSMLDLASEEFELTANNDGTFTIDTPEVQGPFPCEIDGDEFECPDRLLRLSIGLDARIEVRSRDVGVFMSTTSASGVRSADVTCSGTQCQQAAAILGGTVPCARAIAFTVEFKG